MYYLIIISLFIIIMVVSFFIADWLSHLHLNPSGKFISYENLIDKINSSPFGWQKSPIYVDSAFIKEPASIINYLNWYLHANVIILNGKHYKLWPISFFRYKRYMKKWNLPLRHF